MLKKNALTNNVSNKLSIFATAKFETLQKNLVNITHNKTIFLVDIECSEFYLFYKEFCNYFSKCIFIVEDHNFNIVNKQKLKNFYKIIKKNFKIEVIRDVPKNPFEFKILDKFSDDEKYLMMSEARPETMRWLILYPKK